MHCTDWLTYAQCALQQGVRWRRIFGMVLCLIVTESQSQSPLHWPYQNPNCCANWEDGGRPLSPGHLTSIKNYQCSNKRDVQKRHWLERYWTCNVEWYWRGLECGFVHQRGRGISNAGHWQLLQVDSHGCQALSTLTKLFSHVFIIQMYTFDVWAKIMKRQTCTKLFWCPGVE